VRVDNYTRHIDVMPTILDLAGLDCPAQVQGRSLRPLLEGGALEPLPVYTEVYPARPPGYSIFSLVREHHKVIRVSTDDESATMLFDLQADPGEKHDASQTDPELRDTLLREMEVWDGVARMFAPSADAVPLDPRTLQRLKSLGYLN
jgi:arylsulfatase A-like enzyme